MVTYTIPEPGTIGPGHEGFCDAMAHIPHDWWEGDDTGIRIELPEGFTIELHPGTTVTVCLSTRTLRIHRADSPWVRALVLWS